MKQNLTLSMSLCFLLLSAPVAQATLSMNTSARPLDKGHASIRAGLSSIKPPPDNKRVPLPYLELSYGAFKNTNIGVSTDFSHKGFVSFGVDLQYSLFYRNEGPALALNTGIGRIEVIDETPYFYIGSTISYKKNQFEPYISARAIFLKGPNPTFTLKKYFRLGQITAGLNLLCTKQFSLNLNVSTMMTGTKIRDSKFTKFYPGIGVQYSF